MVTTPSVGRCRVLRRGFSLLCFVWAGLALCGLPSLASAEPLAACPGSALEIEEEMPQPEREVRGLRNDLRDSCAALSDRLDQVSARLQSIETAEGNVLTALDQVHDDLNLPGGLPTRFVGQDSSFEAVLPDGVEVTNPPDVGSVQAAVDAGTETSNQNAWAILGVALGFGVLVWLYKVVRP